MLQPGDQVWVGFEDGAQAEGWVTYEIRVPKDESDRCDDPDCYCYREEVVFVAPCGIKYRPKALSRRISNLNPWAGDPCALYHAPPFYFMAEQLIASREMPGL